MGIETIAVLVVALVSLGLMTVINIMSLKRFEEERKYYIKALLSRDSRELATAVDLEKKPAPSKDKLDKQETETVLLEDMDGTDFDEHISSVMGKQ